MKIAQRITKERTLSLADTKKDIFATSKVKKSYDLSKHIVQFPFV